MASLMQNIIDSNKTKTSRHIDALLVKAREEHGEASSAYQGIYHQYFTVPDQVARLSTNSRHFEAEVGSGLEKTGLERMYRRVVVVDLVSACAAECSYCVRGYYTTFSLSNGKIDALVETIAADPHLREVLITGGDPLVAPRKLIYLIRKLASRAANVRFIRIGTRLPVQAPEKFDDELLEVFDSVRDNFGVEVACQINHPYELQDQTLRLFRSMQRAGVSLYSQNVVLKRVNDDAATMLELYDELRYLNITPHYMFHAVPLRGTDKYRTSVKRGLDIISALSSSGLISGRAKPQYALITDIGKVSMYEGTISSSDGADLIIKSSYTLADRHRWNPEYVLPDTAIFNSDGTLSVRYPDGRDDA